MKHKPAVCLFDGTGMSIGDGRTSIIGWIAQQLAKRGVPCHYAPGVGTYGGIARQLINKIFAPTGADGDVGKIIKEAIPFLQNHADRDIYIVGFSRGAAIARRVAFLYQQPVKQVIAFDTVASLGLPNLSGTVPASDVRFANANLAPNVGMLIHALALDENRQAFAPTHANRSRRIRERWFAGTHSDIGGCNDDRLGFAAALWALSQLAADTGIKLKEALKSKYHYNRIGLDIDTSPQPHDNRTLCMWRNDKPSTNERDIPYISWRSIRYANDGVDEYAPLAEPPAEIAHLVNYYPTT